MVNFIALSLIDSEVRSARYDLHVSIFRVDSAIIELLHDVAH